MDKLIERETATRNPLAAAPALAVQFFLIPLAVVAVTVGVYMGFRSLLADARSPQEYLIEIQRGGTDRRWPAAYELSRMMADPKVRGDRTLGPALVKAFQESKSDPQVRRYLALAIGRLDPPLPPAAIADLTGALEDPDSETRISVIWALGSSGDPAVVPRLIPLFTAPDIDAGIRKMVVYALRAAGRDADSNSAYSAAGLGRRCPLECGGRARAPRQSRRRQRDQADARSPVRRTDGEARRAAGRGSGSRRRRDDQRSARRGRAQGRIAQAVDHRAESRRSQPESSTGGDRSVESNGMKLHG